MYKRILVPLDGSPLAEAVLPYAKELARLAGAEIVLLRVSVNPTVEFSFTDPGLASQIVQEMEESSNAYMNAMYEKLNAEGIKTCFLIREGPITDTILDIADAMQIDVIAMSTHGRSGVLRWVMGSIADRIVRHSPIPVLLIRPKNSE